MAGVIRIGTRTSPLALYQTEMVARIIGQTIPVEIVKIKTKGDMILDRPMHSILDKGLFTKELEKAILDGEIDIAVHSLKDVPTAIPDGLAILAYPLEESPADALLTPHGSLDSIPSGGTVATGSLRRKAQLLHLRPDLEIIDIRGNVQTRLEKYKKNQYDGLVLAYAGLKRLGLDSEVAQIFPEEMMIPAVGQGIIAVEGRREDAGLPVWINNNPLLTRAKAEISRGFLAAIEGGCSIPAGCHVRTEPSSMEFTAIAFMSPVDGKNPVKESLSGKIADGENFSAYGKELGETILRGGGYQILREWRP